MVHTFKERQAAIAAGVECTARLAPFIGKTFQGKRVIAIGGYGRDGDERLDFEDGTARWCSPLEISAALLSLHVATVHEEQFKPSRAERKPAVEVASPVQTCKGPLKVFRSTDWMHVRRDDTVEHLCVLERHDGKAVVVGMKFGQILDVPETFQVLELHETLEAARLSNAQE